jgi:hypothetical protein
MRGTTVDFEDCQSLAEAHLTTIDMGRLISHFYEMISYDVSEDRIKLNMDHLLQLLREKGLYD